MARWHDLPLEVRLQILREYCNSLVFEYLKYQTKFTTKRSFALVTDHPYPQPLVNYLNALLTCREFHDSITKTITMANDQSMPICLQDTQYELVYEYSQRSFYQGAAN